MRVRPTFIAVRMLSPVIIKILNLAYCKFLIFLAVSSFRGELQIKNPAKSKSFYIYSLYNYLFAFYFTYFIGFEAKASNRYPCFV